MEATPFTVAGTASTILALSKSAWNLGMSLANIDQGTKSVDTTVQYLAAEVKSLSSECDHVYAELEEVVGKSETGSPPPYDDVADRMWKCLAMQVGDIDQTLQELGIFVNSARGQEFRFVGQFERQDNLEQSKDSITRIKTKVCRHTGNLCTTLLLINTIQVHIAPCQPDRGLVNRLERLQDMVEKLGRSLETDSQVLSSHTEATLIQCAREVIVKGTAMFESSLTTNPVAGGQGAAISNIRVTEWVGTLESLRRDKRRSDLSDVASNVPSVFSGDEGQTVMTSPTSAARTIPENEAFDAIENDFEDDLDVDIAKAALETGTKSFQAREWEEADSLLQEVLRVLQQLPKHQRAFCDIFGLQYKLAVCAYHMQESADAEEALMSLVQQSPSTDEQRGYIYDAAHLLSLLYIRMGHIERARSECEKALQARRRLHGKQSDAALESTALMAHIYVLLNNRARAKSCLAMIPEERRDAIVKNIESSLGTQVERPDDYSQRTRSISGDSDLAVEKIQNRLSASSLAPFMKTRASSPVPAISQSPAASLRQSYQRIPSNKAAVESRQSITVTDLSSAEERSDSRATIKRRPSHDHIVPEAPDVRSLRPNEPPETFETSKGKPLSRKEILDKMGCQPRDRIEDAVCNGDHAGFASLLDRKKDFWRSKLRKRVRPERVTALHFAALFGEIDMARRLLGSSFNINEVPFGYSTSLTPLKFAIGARQVDMVEFLITNGARPTSPDTWSTLAAQLMNRSWLVKTMSEAEREDVPGRMIAILSVLLKHGWDLNAPFETSGTTVLHQAVTFWTGSYKWDLSLRAAMTSFLCEHGADPFQVNTEGKTPYDMASASGHQDLLLVLNRGLNKRESSYVQMEPFELSSEI